MPNIPKCYTDPEKIREIRNKQRADYYKRGRESATNAKDTYTLEEIEMIMKHEISDRELSERLGRSIQAIQIKRHKLNKLKEI